MNGTPYKQRTKNILTEKRNNIVENIFLKTDAKR